MPLIHTFSRPLTRRLSALALALLTTAPMAAQADGVSGAYLATRSADMTGDYQAVVDYGTQALARDPSNSEIMEGLLVAYIGLGQIDIAVPIARRLIQLDPGDQIAGLVLLGGAMKAENWDLVLEQLDDGVSVGGLVDRMIMAWAHLGGGRMSQALTILDELAVEAGSESFALYHKALALALVGDYEGAADILGGDGGALQANQRGIVGYAQILSQAERFDEALDLLDRAFPTPTNAELIQLRADLAEGRAVPLSGPRNPSGAIARVFFTVADTLANEADPQVVLLYSRMAEYLDTELYEATILSAQLLEIMGRYQLAVGSYSRVTPDFYAYPEAALGQADALRRMDRVDEAIGALRALAKAYPDLSPIHVSLGDTLRQEDRFEEAVEAYDAAIALYGDTPKPRTWGVFFARAICHERLDNWPHAEADFRRALELNPGQASVLNYLGYSFLEQKTNLDEALEMIEQAVAAEPMSGYIVDSLGWVYFRLGRYAEAVEQMERAVELMPVDPVVNDHLGDTYWAVGRKREAEFQWSRALSFIADDSDLEEIKPDRIRRKLEIGLDQVLEEEGAAPLTPAE